MAEQNITIDFRIAGTGWADLDIRVGDKFVSLTGVSYTTDVLGDLLRAALMIATGAWIMKISFDQEPSEWRLIAANFWDATAWRKKFSLRVLELQDIYANLPDEQGNLIFEAECEARHFVLAALETARRIFEQTSMSGYEWGNYAFPLRAMRALETAASTEDPPVSESDTEASAITSFRPADE